MIRLTSHRFAMFSKQFGRLPEQDDELFFDEAQSYPVRATRDEIRNQVFAASEAVGAFSDFSPFPSPFPSFADSELTPLFPP